MNVQPGQQLFSIVPLADVWVTANFKETQLKYMKPGQPVEIKVDANGRTYKGKVESIAGSSGARTSLLPPENATGNYVKVVQRIPVKIVLDPGRGPRPIFETGNVRGTEGDGEISEFHGPDSGHDLATPDSKPLDYRVDGDAGDVHGSVGHQRRERRAAAHRRKPFGGPG